jgi:hypothetical protein
MSSTTEIWVAVSGYEGLYEVSDAGRVKNIARRKGTTPGAILKHRPTRDGYSKVLLRNQGADYQTLVHRLVYRSFIGPILDGMQIDHLNGDKTDNTPQNLEAVTQTENIRRSFSRGRNIAKGSRQGRSVFTEAQVLSIKERVHAGEKQNAIAKEFGVTPTAINCIVTGKTWAHVASPHP